MIADLNGFAEEPRKLLTIEDTTVGYEGALIMKYKEEAYSRCYGARLIRNRNHLAS